MANLIFDALTAHPLLLAFSALVVIPAVILVHDFLQYLRLPPGPTPIPFIGTYIDGRDPYGGEIRFSGALRI